MSLYSAKCLHQAPLTRHYTFGRCRLLRELHVPEKIHENYAQMPSIKQEMLDPQSTSVTISSVSFWNNVLIRRQNERQISGGHAPRAHVRSGRQNVHFSANLSHSGAKASHWSSNRVRRIGVLKLYGTRAASGHARPEGSSNLKIMATRAATSDGGWRGGGGSTSSVHIALR